MLYWIVLDGTGVTNKEASKCISVVFTFDHLIYGFIFAIICIHTANIIRVFNTDLKQIKHPLKKNKYAVYFMVTFLSSKKEFTTFQ